jgi:hypothetical protein
MSNNTSGSQKTAREKLQEHQQQLEALQAAAWMEEEAGKKCEEEERKQLAELKRIEASEKRVAAAEEKRRKQIAEEMVSLGCVIRVFSNVRKTRNMSLDNDESCTRCAGKSRTCLWTDAAKNPLVSRPNVSDLS